MGNAQPVIAPRTDALVVVAVELAAVVALADHLAIAPKALRTNQPLMLMMRLVASIAPTANARVPANPRRPIIVNSALLVATHWIACQAAAVVALINHPAVAPIMRDNQPIVLNVRLMTNVALTRSAGSVSAVAGAMRRLGAVPGETSS